MSRRHLLPVLGEWSQVPLALEHDSTFVIAKDGRDFEINDTVSVEAPSLYGREIVAFADDKRVSSNCVMPASDQRHPRVGRLDRRRRSFGRIPCRLRVSSLENSTQ